MTHWHPIDTAPKDGTKVRLKGKLAFTAGESVEMIGWWTDEFVDDGFSYGGWTNGTEIDWPEDSYTYGPEEVFATHWASLTGPCG